MNTVSHSAVAGLWGRGAHQTMTEIEQEPGLWLEVGALVSAWRSGMDASVASALADHSVRVVLCGAGTSGLAGDVLAPALRRRLHRRVDAVHTTDLLAFPKDLLAEDVPTLLVSFARSGDSPESVAVTQLADTGLNDCTHLVLTCNAHGQLAAEHADRPRSALLVLPDAADDRGFAMTSSFTSMVLAA